MSLHLAKETLRSLSNDEYSHVIGGHDDGPCPCTCGACKEKDDKEPEEKLTTGCPVE